MLRALADDTRRQILVLVWRDERTAGEIAAEFAMTRPAVSQHLAILRDSNLVYIDASPETVFGFLVDPALMAPLEAVKLPTSAITTPELEPEVSSTVVPLRAFRPQPQFRLVCCL